MFDILPMFDILIVGKQNNFGLTRDIAFLKEALLRIDPDANIGIAGIRDRPLLNRLLRRKCARTIIHIERIFPAWFSAAGRHLVIPNQERFPRRHLGRLKKIDLVLAKSRHAAEIFTTFGARAVYVGFTSEDRREPDAGRDWSAFFHLAGGSTLKGTEDVIALWRKHPEWPELVLVQKECPEKGNLPANIRLLDGYMDDAELKKLQNRCGIHLCPSRSEGWGHHLVEGMSVGALLLATDGPPMNEHVGPDSAIMLPWSKTEPRRIGKNYYVDADAFEKEIERAIAMTVAEKMRLGSAARSAYEEIDRGFRQRLAEALRQEKRLE